MTPLISEFLFDLLTALSASQVYPRILEWATYPITTLLERVWTVHVKRNLLNPQENGRPDPVYVELISVAERCLNFAHTGAAKVLNRNLMWHMWVTRGILDNGFPRYSITSRTAMTPPSLLRDDPWAESHDLCCFGKLGSKAEGGYPLWTVGTIIGRATEMSFK